MSSPNFSLYLDSLLAINKGEEDLPERVMENLEDWGYIEIHDDVILMTKKGVNVMEFYLKNREFMLVNSHQIENPVIA